jgi:hypothetical protein
MLRAYRYLALVLTLTLTVTSCTSLFQTPLTNENFEIPLTTPETSVGSGTKDPLPGTGDNLLGSDQEKPGLPFPPDYPLVSKLKVDAALIEPGMILRFDGDERLSGKLTLSGPNGTLLRSDFSEGYSVTPIPSDTPDGLYMAVMEGSRGEIALGSVRVVTKPGIWLRADHYSNSENNLIRFEINTYGLPEGMLAGLSIGQREIPPDVARYRKEIFNNQERSIRSLIPNQNGLLVQANQNFIPLNQLVDRPLYAPDMLSGIVQAFAIDTVDNASVDGSKIWVSNKVNLNPCHQTGRVEGVLETGRTARILSVSEEDLHAYNVYPGAFSVDLPAGPAVLYSISMNNQAADQGIDPILIDIPCGGVVTIDFSTGNSQIYEPGSSWSPVPDSFTESQLERLDSIPVNTLHFSGDNPVEKQKIENLVSQCQVIDEQAGKKILKVRSKTADSNDPIIVLRVPGGQENGQYPGVIEIQHPDSGTSQANGRIIAVVSHSSELTGSESALISFSGAYAGYAGSGHIEGKMECNIHHIDTDETHPNSGLSPEYCKSGLISSSSGSTKLQGVLSALSASLEVHLSHTLTQVEFITLEDINHLLQLVRQKQLSAVEEANLLNLMSTIARAEVADYAIYAHTSSQSDGYHLDLMGFDRHNQRLIAWESGSVSELDDLLSYNPIVSDFADAMVQAGLCAEVEPEHTELEPGGQLTLELTLTDLSGTPLEGAQIEVHEISMGRLTSRPGDGGGSNYRLEYNLFNEATGVEWLKIKAIWVGPEGQIESRSIQTLIQIAGNYKISGMFQDRLEAAADPGFEITAFACQAVPSGPYQADIRVGASQLNTTGEPILVPGVKIYLSANGRATPITIPVERVSAVYLPVFQQVLFLKDSQPWFTGDIVSLGLEDSCPTGD